MEYAMSVECRTLCKLLEDRGVEYKYSGFDEDPDGLDEYVIWEGAYGMKYVALVFNGITPSGKIHLNDAHVTPEEAILATLPHVPETCHAVGMDCFGNPPWNKSGLSGNSDAVGCSECGAPWSSGGLFRGNRLKHNFRACPICGRKVVEHA